MFSILSRVQNVSVNSISISSDTKLEVGLVSKSSGKAQAVTIIVMAGKLSGSNVVKDWSASVKASVDLTGSGSLSGVGRIVVMIVPFTG